MKRSRVCQIFCLLMALCVSCPPCGAAAADDFAALHTDLSRAWEQGRSKDIADRFEGALRGARWRPCWLAHRTPHRNGPPPKISLVWCWAIRATRAAVTIQTSTSDATAWTWSSGVRRGRSHAARPGNSCGSSAMPRPRQRFGICSRSIRRTTRPSTTWVSR